MADSSLAYDANGKLHMAYQDAATKSLKYATRLANGRWVDGGVIDDSSPNVGAMVSLALASDGSPAAAYYDAQNGDLKYAHWNGTTWDTQTVDTHGATGLYPSLAFDSGDAPIIASYSATRGDLRLSKLYHGGWRSFTLDAEGDVGRHPALAVDPNSGLWTVAYEATGAGELRFVNAFNGGKVLGGVIDAKALGGSISLAFDGATSRAHVGYADALSGEVRVATGNAAGWTTDVVGKGTAALSVRPGGGTAGLVYRDGSGTLRLAERPAVQKAAWSSVEIGAGTAGSAAAFSAAGDVAVTQPGANPASKTAPAVGERFAAAPTRTTVTHVDATTLRVDWLDNSVGESGFLIESSTDDGKTWQEAAVAGRNATATNVGGLTEGKTYAFRASAKGQSIGSSTASGRANAVPTAAGTDPLDTPGYFRVTGISQQGEERTYQLEDNLTVNSEEWFFGGSWAGAAYNAITGSIHVVNTGATYSIEDSGAFRVGYADDVRAQADVDEAISELPDNHTRILAFEDSHSAIDRDFDDKYWDVQVEKAPKADLDIDSDNNDGLNLPSRTDEEEDAEVDFGLLGKVVAVNDDDANGDGKPDFAELDGNSNENFTPIVLDLSNLANYPQSTIAFYYNDAPASEITTQTTDGKTLYDPGSGMFRIWTKNAPESRNPLAITSGGDMIIDHNFFNTSRFSDSGGSMTLWIEAVRPSEITPGNFVTIWVDLDGSMGAGQAIPMDYIRVTAVDVDLNRVISDQFAGVDVNYSPGSSGYSGIDRLPGAPSLEEKNYILMGARSSGRVELDFDVTIQPNTPALRNKLRFNLARSTEPVQNFTPLDNPGSAFEQENYLSLGGIPRTDPNRNDTITADDTYTLLWGYDSNNDAVLNLDSQRRRPGNGELLQYINLPVKIVTQNAYDEAVATLGAATKLAGGPYTANFVDAFLKNSGIKGAINSVDGESVSVNEYKLTHNVGAKFDTTGTARVNTSTFTMASGSTAGNGVPMVQDIAQSQAMQFVYIATLVQHGAEIGQWFVNPSNSASQSHWFTFTSAAPETEFKSNSSDSIESDLHNTVGAMSTDRVIVSMLVNRVTGANGPALAVTQYRFAGIVNDLYDFDFDIDPNDWTLPGIGKPSKLGATIQAGFGTLGTAGEIFKYEFDFAGTPNQTDYFEFALPSSGAGG